MGVQRYQNSPHFKFFPFSVEGGGAIENQFFPKFKIVQIILGGGGGVKKIMDFFHNLGHFFYGSPYMYVDLLNWNLAFSDEKLPFYLTMQI